MSRLENVARAKELWSKLKSYADECAHASWGPPFVREQAVGALLASVNSCGFDADPQYGYAWSQAQISYATWQDSFLTSGKMLLDYRAAFLLDGDPMARWWSDSVAQVLPELAQDEAINTVLAPIKDSANALSGIFEGGSWLVIAVIVILFLVLAIKVT